MKLYKFDYKGTIGNNVITVPTDSQFLVGISNGDNEAVAKLYDGETEIPAEEDKVGEYTCFRFETGGDAGEKKYKAVINGTTPKYDYKTAWTYELTGSKADIVATDLKPWGGSEELRPEKVEIRYRDANDEVLGTVTYHFTSQMVSGGTLRVVWSLDEEFASEEYACPNIWFKAKAAYTYNVVAFKKPGEDSYTEITKNEAETLIPIEIQVPYTQTIDLLVIAQKMTVAYRDLEGGGGEVSSNWHPITVVEPTGTPQTITITRDNAEEIERTAWRVGGYEMENLKSLYFMIDRQNEFPTYDHVWRFRLIVRVPDDFESQNPEHEEQINQLFSVLLGDNGEFGTGTIYMEDNTTLASRILDSMPGTVFVLNVEAFDDEVNEDNNPLAYATSSFMVEGEEP